MNDNKYFYITENSIACKKQYYGDILNDMQINSSKMIKYREKLLDEIKILKEKIVYTYNELRKVNAELSIIDIDIYVCEDDYVKILKYENDGSIVCNSISNVVKKIDLLNDTRNKLIEKRKLLVIKKKLLKNKINSDKKRIKDLNRNIKYNNYNIGEVQKTMHKLDVISSNGNNTIEARKITPKVKKRRNNF